MTETLEVIKEFVKGEMCLQPFLLAIENVLLFTCASVAGVVDYTTLQSKKKYLMPFPRDSDF